MKKKFQVFVSSTYSDLMEERTAVMQCLLEMNCIPVGMEQFPASNMNQMDYIRMMLDDCDYYVLILAGRYGSLDTDGVGYTEKEYDYAIEHNIPIMSFVIDDVGKLVSSKCESSDLGREKLTDFRNKVCTGKLVKFYSDIGSLKSAVAVSLNRCIQDFPAVGWVRGNALEPRDKEDDLKTKVLQILEEHTISNEEIDRLFEHLGNEELVLDCGGASKNKKHYLSVANSGRFTFDYSNNDGKYVIGTGEYEFITRWSKASNRSIHAYRDYLGVNGAIARLKAPTGWPTVIDDGCDFSSRTRTPEIGDIIIWKNSRGKYAATRIIDIKDDTRGADYDELTCEYTIYREAAENTTAYVEMKNTAGGHTVIIDDEKYIAERIVEEHNQEIERLLKEI